MIRLALAFLGWGAGAASAQGMVSAAPIVDACGGTRMVLTAAGAEPDQMERAADVVSARMGGFTAEVFDFAQVDADQIIVSLPAAIRVDRTTIAGLLGRVDFALYPVEQIVSGPVDGALGQVVMPSVEVEAETYILGAQPILTESEVRAAQQIFDFNNQPAISFELTEGGAKTFGDFTASHVGEALAITLRGEVLSAPVIQAPITGGAGIITGDFTVEEAMTLAAVLQGGVLPFGLEIVEEFLVDGSNPSADFCP